MTLSTSLRNLRIIDSVPSLKPPIQACNALFSRVYNLFSLHAGYFIAMSSFCVYNLYKAYQINSHNPLMLDDKFKMIKCKALLMEAQENDENTKALLQECELILSSMADNSSHKESVLLELALYYAKNDPAHSYEIAQKLKHSSHLLEALQKNYDYYNIDKLNILCTKAFNAKMQENEQSSLNVDGLLIFAKHYYAIGYLKGVENCLVQVTANTIEKKDKKLSEIKTFCEIAKLYQKIDNLQKADDSLQLARDLLTESMSKADLINAHIILADTLFLLFEYEKLKEALYELVDLVQDNPTTTEEILYPFAKLCAEIKEHPFAESNLNKFILNFINIPSLIERCLQSHISETKEKRIELLLRIASIYDEGCLEDPHRKKALLELAESLLPQTKSRVEYESALEILAEGYLKFDRQKSIKLFDDYQNYQVKNYLIRATISAISAGILHFYPQSLVPLMGVGLLGSAVIYWHRNHR